MIELNVNKQYAKLGEEIPKGVECLKLGICCNLGRQWGIVKLVSDHTVWVFDCQGKTFVLKPENNEDSWTAFYREWKEKTTYQNDLM